MDSQKAPKEMGSCCSTQLAFIWMRQGNAAALLSEVRRVECVYDVDSQAYDCHHRISLHGDDNCSYTYCRQRVQIRKIVRTKQLSLFVSLRQMAAQKQIHRSKK